VSTWTIVGAIGAVVAAIVAIITLIYMVNTSDPNNPPYSKAMTPETKAMFDKMDSIANAFNDSTKKADSVIPSKKALIEFDSLKDTVIVTGPDGKGVTYPNSKPPPPPVTHHIKK
jgi:hypothetical protein